jgi:dihydrofolate reductase
MKNSVFIATSLDGYIADKEGNIDWLHAIPNPNQIDMGYKEFISSIDAIVMGRNTFETVCGFDMDWPYVIPVFVLSNSLEKIEDKYSDKVFLVKGSLNNILTEIHNKGFKNLYIDGGTTIQNFLKENLIDEMTITTIPTLLGGGTPLFKQLEKSQSFECFHSEIFLNKVVQSKFRKVN